ncbi:Uncharacterised protein [uncultured archaeon]|nr:Uncharacterised protein [uncultured archaeon]
MSNVSNTVSKIIDKMTYLHTSIKRGLLNYSALAREIKPIVEQELGVKVGDDSLIMAVRRYCLTKQKNTNENDISTILANCSLLVRTGMVQYNTKRSEEIYHKIIKEMKINWGTGERRYIIQRSDEMTIITNAKFTERIKKIIEEEPGSLISHNKDLSLITLNIPEGALENPEILSTTSSLIAENKINIKCIFSTYGGLSFLIMDNQAAKAYSMLHEIIVQARITSGQNLEKNSEED